MEHFFSPIYASQPTLPSWVAILRAADLCSSKASGLLLFDELPEVWRRLPIWSTYWIMSTLEESGKKSFLSLGLFWNEHVKEL